MALGTLLMWGNLSGRLMTVPFAGIVTLAVGGMIVASGRGHAAGEETP
jgi:hypothetical protein